MKYIKYLAIVLILVAVVAAVIHSRRDAIARNLANRVLQDFGVTTESLSIERLTPNRAELSRIFLSHDNGTRFEINNVSFPVTFPSERFEEISIERLLITPAEDPESGPPPFADLVGLAASLPSLLPNSRITVGELALAGKPVVKRIEWRTEAEDQSLKLAFGSLAASASLSRRDDSSYAVALDATVDGEPAFAQQLAMEATPGGYSMTGTTHIELAPWLPLLKTMELVSPATVAIQGRLSGPVSVELSREDGSAARIEASMTPAGELQASYQRSEDVMLTLRSVSDAPFVFRVESPAFDWTLEHAKSEIVADVGLPLDLPLELHDLNCRSGISCTARVGVAIEAFEDDELVVRDLTLSAPLAIDIDEDTAVIFAAPETVLSTGGVRVGDARVGTITTSRFSGARLVNQADGWTAELDAIQLQLEAVEIPGGITASAPLSVEDLTVTDSGSGLSAAFAVNPGESSLGIPGLPVLAPGAEGEVEIDGDDLSSTLILLGDRGDELASIAIEHDAERRSGNAVVSDALLDMNRKNLSQYWRNWPYGFDVVSGQWTAEAELSWQPDGEELAIGGIVELEARDLSGALDDIVFADLSTSQRLSVEAGSVSHLGPAELKLGLLEIGVPIEDIEVEYTLDTKTPSVQVSQASASVMGGTVQTQPFDFEPGADSTTVQVLVDSIQLSFISEMIGFESVSLSGSVSGALPVTLSGETLTVAGGRLESDPSGGAIRYSSGDAGEDATTNLGIVMRSLSNFEYESLTSDVDYDENGDLKLKMRLTGTNPDVDPLQPVILNLGLENNIPKMLESLQVTRAVEDVLKRRAESGN